MYCFIFSIIIYILVGETVHGKDVVDGLNYRDKWIIKLEMEKLFNPELILGDPKFSGSCRSMKINKIKL